MLEKVHLLGLDNQGILPHVSDANFSVPCQLKVEMQGIFNMGAIAFNRNDYLDTPLSELFT